MCYLLEVGRDRWDRMASHGSRDAASGWHYTHTHSERERGERVGEGEEREGEGEERGRADHKFNVVPVN